MDFENPANGHIESKSVPWLWTLLFGGLYFVVSGLWTHVVIWLVLVVAMFSVLGQYAAIFMLPVQLAYAAFAGDIVSNSYLKKGWVQVGNAAPPPEELRICPYCAEDIKLEAIKCKHCGSELVA